mmetsp:Transcript_160915/g.516442  ORF Transcript_160915/g.516442 Transcript_160915/m.516442 type:complete len:256 (-) Transcript_160915:307-1074(-)
MSCRQGRAQTARNAPASSIQSTSYSQQARAHRRREGRRKRPRPSRPSCWRCSSGCRDRSRPCRCAKLTGHPAQRPRHANLPRRPRRRRREAWPAPASAPPPHARPARGATCRSSAARGPGSRHWRTAGGPSRSSPAPRSRSAGRTCLHACRRSRRCRLRRGPWQAAPRPLPWAMASRLALPRLPPPTGSMPTEKLPSMPPQSTPGRWPAEPKPPAPLPGPLSAAPPPWRRARGRRRGRCGGSALQPRRRRRRPEP